MLYTAWNYKYNDSDIITSFAVSHFVRVYCNILILMLLYIFDIHSFTTHIFLFKIQYTDVPT